MTQKRLRHLFGYHPDGFFIEKTNRNPSYKNTVGRSVKGTLYKNGYLMMTIDGKLHSLSRMIYLWHQGYLPQCVDHINRIRTDNRIENLRSATRTQNRNNSGPNKNNRSGFKGVSPLRSGRWVAVIRREGKQMHLGTFNSPKEAAQAYDKACKLFDKEFACPNF